MEEYLGGKDKPQPEKDSGGNGTRTPVRKNLRKILLFALLGLECAACSTWIVVSFFLRAGDYCEIENAIQVERALLIVISDEKHSLDDGVVPTSDYLAKKKDDLIRAGLGKALEDFDYRVVKRGDELSLQIIRKRDSICVWDETWTYSPPKLKAETPTPTDR